MDNENSVCKYCKYRNSWDCGDVPHPKDGCGSWSLDADTLSDKQTKTLKRVLISTLKEEDESCTF